MSILAVKLWLLIVFLDFTNIITIVAQPDFLAHYCDSDMNYTRNNVYRINLDTTLTTLLTTDSGLGFFNHSTGHGSSSAKSIALCRGDVKPNLCRSCVNDSIVKLRELCPNQMEAIGYYDYCMLRYSNQTLLGNTEIKYGWYFFESQNFSDSDQFYMAPGSLLNDLTDEAATGGSLRKFATGNKSGVYGLTQCTPDLSKKQCTYCLQDRIIVYRNLSGTRVGGRVLAPMCHFRYEIYPFYNNSALVIPPPPVSSPSPSPSPGTQELY